MTTDHGSKRTLYVQERHSPASARNASDASGDETLRSFESEPVSLQGRNLGCSGCQELGYCRRDFAQENGQAVYAPCC